MFCESELAKSGMGRATFLTERGNNRKEHPSGCSAKVYSAYQRSEVLNLLMNIFTYVSEVLIIYIYFAGVFERKYNLTKTLLIGLLFFVVPFTLNQLWNNPVVNTLSFFIFTVCYIFFTHRIKFLQTVLQGVIVTAIMVATELVTTYTVSIVLGEDSFFAYRDNTVFFVIVSVLSKISFLIGCKLCNHFKLRNDKIYSLPLSDFIFCVAVITTLIVITRMNVEYGFSNIIQTMVVISSILLMFSLLFVFISHERNAVKNAELIKLRSEQQKQEIDSKYLQIIEHNNKNLSILAHDIKNHMLQIKSMENAEEIHSYVDSIVDEVQGYGYVGISKNKTLDLLISKYLNLCDGRGIKIIFDVKTSNLSGIAPADISTIINNLLDNAVESAEKSEKKEISVSIFKKQGHEIINIINSCDNKPKAKGDKLLTTKKEDSIHGYGTQSVIKTLKKYEGVYSWEYDEKEKIFETNVLLPME